MTDRANLLAEFLSTTDWHTADRTTVAGDASNRRYERLTQADGRTAILMDAPPEKGEDVRPFCEIARHLSDIGLSAPTIVSEDTTNGFLILEDLGDDLFARVVIISPELESPLYEAATDVLVHLHRCPTPPLARYDTAVMTDMAAHAYRWYARGADREWQEAMTAFTAGFAKLLDAHTPLQTVLIQRDYHAENLLWLPERDGVQRVGLLDFQDAMLGHPAYDLVSLLQDARRDVPASVERAMITRYVTATDQNPETFDTAYHLLGAQRNLRILGVFARLSMHFGKPHYVDLIPRVYDLLLRDLAHPVLAPMKDQIIADLPKPDTETLNELKAKCGTVPTL